MSLFSNEEAFANAFIAKAKEKRLNIVRWFPNKSVYPQYMLLGGDKGILAYLNFYLNNESRIEYSYSDLIKRIRYAISDLDRPVFNVHWMGKMSGKVLFDTYEQLLDEIYSVADKSNLLETNKFIQDAAYMGDEAELFSIFHNLKMYSVKLS